MFDRNRSNYALLASIGIGSLGLFLLRKHFKGGQFTRKILPLGEVIVVTGANTGIGLETVRELNKRGAKVYMLCRSEERAAAARKDLIKVDSSNRQYMNCDLGSMESIRKCAADLSQREKEIDTLINNAGVWMGGYEKTKEGHEMTWGTNHLGHFLLTELLLPRLQAAAEGRIINVASVLHASSTPIYLEKIDSEEGFDAAMAYNKSKLANVMHARELTRRLREKDVTTVSVNSLHPGVIATEILRNVGFGVKVMQFLGAFFMKTWKDGAQTTLYCALSPDITGVSGEYFSDCARKDVAPLAKDDLACKQLYDYSLKAVGLE